MKNAPDAAPGAPRPLRICHVLASVGNCGGLEKNVLELSGAQAALGHHVTLVVDPSLAPHAAPGVHVATHPMSAGRVNLPALWRLRGALGAQRPDLIHAHANKAAAMVRTLRGLRLLPAVPTVATVQNTKSNARPFRGYTRLIAVSEDVRRSLGGLPASIIWNSIPPPPASARAAALATCPPFLDSDHPLLCSVGRLVPAKGFDLLLRALATVPRARLWIVGDGPLRAELERLTAELGLTDRVWFAGHRADAVGLMGCARLFVVASRNEGGPYTLAEALHMRTPVLSTRVGFAPELLPSEALVPTLDIDALASALRRILADPAAFAAALEPSFALAAAEITLDAMTAKVLALYRECLPAGATRIHPANGALKSPPAT